MVDVKAVSAVLEQTPLDSETREYLLGSLADCETEEEAMDVRLKETSSSTMPSRPLACFLHTLVSLAIVHPKL